MISIKIISTPTALEKLSANSGQIVERMQRRMDLIMLKLQSKIVGETIPEMFPNGAPNIASTVATLPARTAGTIIHGEVRAGGPRTTKRTLWSGAEVDYAIVQHEGIAHSYPILPFNKRALSFLLEGNRVIVKRVTHPGLKPRPYMTSALKAMAEQIVAEFQAEVNAFLAG